MKIASLKIKNFRGYQDEIEISFDDLTVFVGKNDIGKSTILEALDIFFNDGKGAVKIDKSDVNINEGRSGNLESVISVCFTDIPENVVIDTNVETSLQKEYLLNSQGRLEIVKRYKSGGAAKVFIRANHPTNPNCAELLLKKNNELKHILDQENIECANRSVNSVIRKSIWDKFSDNLQLQDIEIDAAKEDAKVIWGKIANYLPVYSLFQSDRKNSDGDSEVQDPLKEAVRQILASEEIQAKLTEIADVVKDELQQVSDRTLEKLREMNPAIADSLSPVIPSASSLKWNDVFKSVSIAGEGDIPINKRGSGTKRLILLSFFRGEAERKSLGDNGPGVIYAIEEPETSQHTENQKLLIEALKGLSTSENTQVVLTTHSSYIVKQLQFSDLRLIEQDENGCKSISAVQPGQLRYPSLNEVNFIAFDEVTEEYHDELYGFIEFQGWLREYCSGRTQIPYIRQNHDGTSRNEHKVLTEYIRHQIHHPENTLNPRYTKEQLRQSIMEMRNFISLKANTQVVVDP